MTPCSSKQGCKFPARTVPTREVTRARRVEVEHEAENLCFSRVRNEHELNYFDFARVRNEGELDFHLVFYLEVIFSGLLFTKNFPSFSVSFLAHVLKTVTRIYLVQII